MLDTVFLVWMETPVTDTVVVCRKGKQLAGAQKWEGDKLLTFLSLLIFTQWICKAIKMLITIKTICLNIWEYYKHIYDVYLLNLYPYVSGSSGYTRDC